MLHDVLRRVKGEPRLADKKSIVLASREWHPGIIGIVAARIVDIYHRPTILIALQNGSGRGSGRSIPKFHLHDALHACSEHLLKLLTLDLCEDLMKLRESCDSDLTPDIIIDRELSGEEITFELAETIESLSPFGMGNPEPVFMVRGATIVDRRVLKDRHVKLRLAAGGKTLDAIGFNMAQNTNLCGSVDVAFSLDVNKWNGRSRLQLRLKDCRQAQ
jgi:single-stranded-DNA-specific exonuclease